MIASLVSGIFGRELRHLAHVATREIAAFSVVAACLAVAAVAVAVAAYQALLTVWPPYWAAAAIAGGALVPALTLVAVRAGRRPRSPGRGSASASPKDLLGQLDGDSALLVQKAIDEAELRYRQDPAGFIVAAVAAGVVVGMLRKG